MKNTVRTFQMAKEKGEKLTMLTAYDYSTARLMEEAGINAILVGDSLGNTMLGYEDTISVTVEDMIHHGAGSFLSSIYLIASSLGSVNLSSLAPFLMIFFISASILSKSSLENGSLSKS